MAGFFKLFAAVSVAGLGWSLGKRVGEKLWNGAEQHYPDVKESVNDFMSTHIEPLLSRAKSSKEQSESDEGEGEEISREDEGDFHQ